MDPSEKKTLLEEIQSLLAYGGPEPSIDPSLLEYLDGKTLTEIRERLREKTSTLKEEDREWLAQFRKED